jgi:ATP-dependent DNA helicase RecG
LPLPDFEENEGVNQESEGVNQESEGANQKNEGTNRKNEGTNRKNEGVNIAIENVIKQEIAGIGNVLSEKLTVIVFTILINEGKRVPDYSKITLFSEKSIERYLKQLSSVNLIEFKGEAIQTGGYYLTPKMKQK